MARRSDGSPITGSGEVDHNHTNGQQNWFLHSGRFFSTYGQKRTELEIESLFLSSTSPFPCVIKSSVSGHKFPFLCPWGIDQTFDKDFGGLAAFQPKNSSKEIIFENIENFGIKFPSRHFKRAFSKGKRRIYYFVWTLLANSFLPWDISSYHYSSRSKKSSQQVNRVNHANAPLNTILKSMGHSLTMPQKNPLHSQPLLHVVQH